MLLHLIDIYSDDVAASYKTIRHELSNYSEELATRPEVIALTKCEGFDDDMIAMQVNAVKAVAGKNAEVMTISSSGHVGLKKCSVHFAQK